MNSNFQKVNSQNETDDSSSPSHGKTIISYEVPVGTYKEGQQVNIVIKSKTELGYKAIVDGKYWGILYHNEVFQHIKKDQETIAYVKKLREDNRLDLILYKAGNLQSKEIGDKILEALDAFGGYLNITSDTQPEDIYTLFGVSKKKFKIAIGGLYKKRLIEIKDDGLYLISAKS